MWVPFSIKWCPKQKGTKMLSLKSKYRTNTCGELNKSNVGETVTLSGWVHRKRDHGALLFVDLRDNYGITQCVFDGGNQEMERVRPESVIQITGTVVARDAAAVNDKIEHIQIQGSISSGDALPALRRTAASVVGRNCIDDVFITTNRIMAFVAVSPDAIDFTALMP